MPRMPTSPSSAAAIHQAADIPVAIQRYLAGESVQQIATEMGVHRQRIYEWMLAGAGDEHYSDIVTQVLVRRVSEADEALESASVEPDTARARARATFARMDLERRRPGLYGPRQQSLQITILRADETLAGQAAQLLDQLRIVEGGQDGNTVAITPLQQQGDG